MRKSLASRIIGLAAIYCFVFILLVIIQFSSKSSFSLSTGDMTIRSRYLTDNSQIVDSQADTQTGNRITGGARIFYGGLEFILNEERGKGLLLSGRDGSTSVNPEIMYITENTARFVLPGGSAITFSSSDSVRGAELQVSAVFADNISEITVPVTPRRSSLVRDNDQIGIIFGGSRFFLNTSGKELENGKLIFTKDNSLISYRARSRERVFNPSDFIISRAQNYDTIIRNWQNVNFTHWNQNTAQPAITFQNESDVIAFMSESIQRGSYQSAVNTFSENYRGSPELTFRSSVYVGRIARTIPTFISAENEKMLLITRLTREKSPAIFREEHILDYLFTRSNIAIANEIIDMIGNLEPQMLIPEYAAGLLEAFDDLKRWRAESIPMLSDSIDQLTRQILTLISENLTYDSENDLVYVSINENRNPEYNLRLGKALINSQIPQTMEPNADWTAIGRSLVISAFGRAEPVRPQEGAGRLHSILKPVENSPRALWLTDTGHWAWTVSSSARAAFQGANMTLTFTYPVNNIHYVIIRGVRPFIRIQIHGQDWRSDSQFEIYDSSGWVYYPQEQILVLKLRHRSTTENVRIIYRVDPPPVQPAAPAPGVDTVE